MRLLLDECVPRPLKRDLVGHDVHHVVDMGWSSKRNGELLQLMVADGFDALLTVDQSLEFQQNLGAVDGSLRAGSGMTSNDFTQSVNMPSNGKEDTDDVPIEPAIEPVSCTNVAAASLRSPSYNDISPCHSDWFSRANR